jgi:probable rRNA maturation factor
VADPDSRLEVTISDGRGRTARAPGLAAWLRRVAPAAARGAVSIALVTDARIRALNRTYRGKDVTTDVLSFAAAAERDTANFVPRMPHAALRTPPAARRTPATHALGDIAIATGVARRQAREAGHSYAAELRVLALHGLLHLLGYDHENPADAGRMARLERRLRAKGNLRSGLIERAGR